MAPHNLAARKSSAIQSGTQNLSEMQHPSLVLNDQLSDKADHVTKIVMIKPPGVEFKRKATEGLIDDGNKTALLSNQNISSENNLTKRGSGHA